MESLLTVKQLTTHFVSDEGIVRAVDGVSFSLKRGETLGVVGESGCGKTVMGLSLMRLLFPSPTVHPSGSLLYNHQGVVRDLMMLSEREMQRVRGKNISMVFQEPMTSLNPLYTIGDQIGEAIVLHEGGARAQVREKTLEMLKLVGIPAPQERIDAFPHELSGGMRQRAMIAMALACKPDILIADEPTTALDVTIQAQILELLRTLQKTLHMSVLLITHDLGVVAEMADRVMVMYAGECVEEGTVQEIFQNPRHPYTQALLRSLPPLEVAPKRMKMPTITGTVPHLARLPKSCRFQDRCPKVQPPCRENPIPEDPCRIGRLVRCLYATDAKEPREPTA